MWAVNGTISQTQANVTGKTAPKSKISRFAIVCIVCNFLFIIAFALLKYFEESGEPILPFFWFFVFIPLLFLIFLLLIVAVGYFFVRFRTNIKRAAFPLLPFLINGTIFLTFWLVPVHAIWGDLKFRLKKDSYKKIVQMVEEGHIQPDKGLADLPPEYRHLSRGGDIFIEKGDKVTTVLFHTSFKYGLSWGKGLTRLAGLSGYMYRSDGTLPPERFKVLDWVYVKRIEANWFYYDSMIVDK